ncbi:MAG TPA: hypothetical protein VF323_08195 [Candidatus Limnocylindrales bacterium]
MAGHVGLAPAGHQERTMGERLAGWRYLPVALAVGSIWLAVLVASVFAPVMITGSNHERLAIAALGDWLWGGLATGLLLLAAAFVRPERTGIWPVVALTSAVIWAAVAIASVFAPDFVTGTDPTTIPLAAMLAPIAGSIVTAFLAVFAAGMGARPAD